MTPGQSTARPADVEAVHTRRPDGRDDESLVDLRCSTVILRDASVLLLHRTDVPASPGAEDWVLPGGRPRPGEGMAACVRREAAEEVGLDVVVGHCLFVLDVAAAPPDAWRSVELVFAGEVPRDAVPQSREAHRRPEFVPLSRIAQLRIRPPIAGHLRALARRGHLVGAPYLGNLWRPAADEGGGQ